MSDTAELTCGNGDLACSSEYILPIVSLYAGSLPAQSVVVDLGCGNGSLLARLSRPGLECHGMDVSAYRVAAAHRAYPDLNVSVADLTGDLSSHPLAGLCDLVISTEVVEHVFLPRAFARNCYALLKPGGSLVISTPYHGYAKNVALALTGRLDVHFTAMWDYGHIKFWSRRTLGSLLQEAGFYLDRFHGAGRVPYLWKSMVLVASKH